MSGFSDYHLVSLAVLLLLVPTDGYSQAQSTTDEKVKVDVFHSPEIVLGPGSVSNKYYYNLSFPKGHIAIKDFNAEVVDEAGNPVPLSDVYLHHWVVIRYNQEKKNLSNIIANGNAGVCPDVLMQHFGLGSETRRTLSYIPEPYGIEIGNPTDVPEGYQEGWTLNVHAIDTRGVEDRFGCIECRCNLYNVTKDDHGHDIKPDYFGGLQCCPDNSTCKLKEGFQGRRKKVYYLKYTVKYVDWDPASIVPVKIYIFDVTDKWTKPQNPTTVVKHQCQIEYQVESCSADGNVRDCTDSRNKSFSFPSSGDLIYGVSHLHKGGIGSTLYGEDGNIICASTPIYGKGTSAGDEDGYLVGMSTCYPKPGSIKLTKWETLTLVTNYSNSERHAGVMGLFYIVVAEPLPKPNFVLNSTDGVRF